MVNNKELCVVVLLCHTHVSLQQISSVSDSASFGHQVHVSGQGPECYVASFLLCSKCQGVESDE